MHETISIANIDHQANITGFRWINLVYVLFMWSLAYMYTVLLWCERDGQMPLLPLSMPNRARGASMGWCVCMYCDRKIAVASISILPGQFSRSISFHRFRISIHRQHSNEPRQTQLKISLTFVFICLVSVGFNWRQSVCVYMCNGLWFALFRFYSLSAAGRWYSSSLNCYYAPVRCFFFSARTKEYFT